MISEPEDGMSDITEDSFHIPQGDDWSRRWPVFEADGVTPQDLSGYSAKCQIRHAYGQSVIHEFSSGAGTITLGADGFLALLLAKEDSAAWAWRNGVFDIKLTDLAGNVETIIRGSVFLDRTVTV